MTLPTLSRSVSVALALASLCFTLPAPGQTPAQIALEREGLELMRQLAEVGEEVEYHAAHLNSYTRNVRITRWTHGHHLNQIRDLVNVGLRPALTRLEQIQPQLPEWKKRAVDNLLAAARDLSADMELAILNSNSVTALPPALNATYKAAIGRIEQHSVVLIKTASAAIAYAAAHLKAAEAGLAVRP